VRLLSPWALLGLVAIAGPIAAHLLARRPPKRLRFPNLRFLPQTVPMPVQRNRLTDLGLLSLRIAIVAMAALSLARPTFRDSGRPTVSAVTPRPASAPPIPSSTAPPISVDRELTMLTGQADRASAEAALSAAVKLGAPARVAGDRDVALVFPGFESRERLLKDAAPLSYPWMSDLFTAIAKDELVAAAAARLDRVPLDVIKVTGDRAQQGRMLVFIDAPPHSLIGAAATSVVLRSVPSPSSVTSVDLISADSGTSSVDSLPADQSAGRLFWIAVGVLLLIETAARRRRRTPESEERARVA